MKNRAMSRQTILEAGTCALAAAAGIPQIASAHAETGLSPKSDETIRKWYAAWEKKDWHPLDILLADDFTFTSAAGDDHISKSAFKTQCWDTQVAFIGHFDLERITTGAEEAFVKYLCQTKNGK